MFSVLEFGFVYGFLVALSFVFSAAETSYSSLRLTLIRLTAAKGNRLAQRVLKLANDLPHTLNAIIIGDNVINLAFTSLATYAGYTFYGALGALAFSLANFVVVFVVSEAWPKNLAVNNPENIAMMLSPFMAYYVQVMDKPAAALSRVGQSLSSVFSRNQSRKQLSAEERMLYAVELAKIEGVITDKQQDVINRLLKFDDISAGDLMIPAEKTVTIPSDHTVEEAMKVFGSAGHRRLPVVGLAKDNGKVQRRVVGALYIRDASVLFMNGYAKTSVQDVCEPTVVVRHDSKLIDVFNKMQKSGAQVAAIEKEGEISGFIFMNDLLETIVGETFSKRPRWQERLKKRRP
jgi:putative hemolysin